MAITRTGPSGTKTASAGSTLGYGGGAGTSGIGPLSAGLQIGGMVAGGYGAMNANKDARSYNKGLDYFKRQNINPLLEPLQTSLYAGLAPGGLLREQLSAEGRQQALGESTKALQDARSAGSRTSARAQDLRSLAGILRTMGQLQAQNAGGIAADQTVAGMRVNSMGAADALQPMQQTFSPWTTLGAGLSTAGRAVGQYATPSIADKRVT